MGQLVDLIKKGNFFAAGTAKNAVFAQYFPLLQVQSIPLLLTQDVLRCFRARKILQYFVKC